MGEESDGVISIAIGDKEDVLLTATEGGGEEEAEDADGMMVEGASTNAEEAGVEADVGEEEEVEGAVTTAAKGEGEEAVEAANIEGR